jgi:hypothetical protein
MIERPIKLDLDGNVITNTKILLNAANRNSLQFKYDIQLRGKPIDLSKNHSARLVFRRPDKGVIEDVVSDLSGGITYVPVDALFAVNGAVVGQVNLLSDTETAASLYYVFGVVDDLLGDTIEDNDYMSTFERIVGEMEEKLGEAERIIEELGELGTGIVDGGVF